MGTMRLVNIRKFIGRFGVNASYAEFRPVISAIAITVVVAVAVLLAPIQSAHAKYASLVLDAETGKVLHAVNADTRNYPASLTKMMTIYMVFDALKRGEITPDSKWTPSARAIRQPASKLGMKRVRPLRCVMLSCC